MERELIIVLGPTGAGKTDFAIREALRYDSPVISCDSRQLFKEMSIGTAVPSRKQLAAVKHYFIQDHSIHDNYSAGDYEREALDLIDRLFDEGHEKLVMCGGSMMYIEAVCNGLDDFPDIPMELRAHLLECLKDEGLDTLVSQLKELDPETAGTIDLSNPQRVVRALEVCIYTGESFSSFKTHASRERNFKITKLGITHPREILYERIERRVDIMIARGLEREARGLIQWRDLPALQTVGYREMFNYFDHATTFDRTVEFIKRNTRHYAKRQLTWWKRETDIKWIEPES